jgi:hypothetical protein
MSASAKYALFAHQLLSQFLLASISGYRIDISYVPWIIMRYIL